MGYTIQIISVIGFLLSIYSLYVEKKFARTKKKAICDINEKMSCTKAFKSHYSKTLGIPNSIHGIIFYVVVFLVAFYGLQYVFYLAVLGVLGSIYLAYNLYFKIKTFCLVCSSIYLVNILLLIFSYLKL